MPVSRFAVLAGIPERTYRFRLARLRTGGPLPVKGPWPAPKVDAVEAIAAKYAAEWPAWGHRKIAALMRADGHPVSDSTVERAMRRRGLLLPPGFRADHKTMARVRRQVFVEPVTHRNRVWQMDFSEFETLGGGIWRLCAVVDYASKYCLALTVTPTSRARDAIACVHLAISEATDLLTLTDLRTDRAMADLADETTGEVIDTVPAPIALVTDNGSAFKSASFAELFTGADPLLKHVRTRVRSPQTNGVVERFFGTAKYEHLYRAPITDGAGLAYETARFRTIYNTLRPHQAIGYKTPVLAYLQRTTLQES
jgi:transposase InsO family protein